MIDVFNTKRAALTGDDLAPFMHDPSLHNGKSISRAEVAHGPMTAFSALRNVEFSVDDMHTSGNEFRCTLFLKPVAGDPRSVQEAGGFVEKFRYTFADDGRISECTTDLDIDKKKEEVLAMAQGQKA